MGANDESKKNSKNFSVLPIKGPLVKPERSRITRDHPNYQYYLTARKNGIKIMPSTSGNDPFLDSSTLYIRETPFELKARVLNILPGVSTLEEPTTEFTSSFSSVNYENSTQHSSNSINVIPENANNNLHRRISKQGYNTKNLEKNIDLENPTTIKRLTESKISYNSQLFNNNNAQFMKEYKNQNPSLWILYCKLITIFIPSSLLNLFGISTENQKLNWREKIGLISVIFLVSFFVGLLTFGLPQIICNNSEFRLQNSYISKELLVINGIAYDLSKSSHPGANGIPEDSNILYSPINAGGMDASFLFQNVNGNCKGLIKPLHNTTIPYDSDGNMGWYFPCKLFKRDGSSTPNFTWEYYNGYACHYTHLARESYYSLDPYAQIYFTWNDIQAQNRSLIVYSGNVLDLDLINWMDTNELDYPFTFNELKNDRSIIGKDVTLLMTSSYNKKIMKCLSEVIRVGSIDSDTVGCIASQVILFISLSFVAGLVIIKFSLACFFAWYLSSKRLGSMKETLMLSQLDREAQIESWSDNIEKHAQTISDSQVLNKNFCNKFLLKVFSFFYSKKKASSNSILQPSITMSNQFCFNTQCHFPNNMINSPTEYQLKYTVPQPSIYYQPFGFPLAHTICLVTAYSESYSALRSTLDSLATSTYPNSHKLLMVVCDGLIKGEGNCYSTPDICLSMMKEFSIPLEQVVPQSYLSIASGYKRLNMALVYSGFYNYDDDTVSFDKQQRVPMILIIKCGTYLEKNDRKPGNRGKRDSQVLLMNFLQHVMFDERMSRLDYEIYLGISQITGVSPSYYELCLMVDADTKVYPDALTIMVGSMVKDSKIMGLCGETKISNKRESYVTMIQVFEYYISHHLNKAFESVFGGVTCLPGCFCMYRIKAPKGPVGYWVPILANPDIVGRYSEHEVDTLHKKNLLLLGEDRYLSTLMLKTFPMRKQIFVPQAVCKTMVPNSIKILLSQRRRWINSTIHNLMELLLVKDLCGVFCFSMQFVVFIELIGTIVLPAALLFTIYLIVAAFVMIPFPLIPLILLSLILGLPGVLIVITAQRWSYIMWMFIYITSLPLWNFLLPLNAFWKFDDFSWGDTRAIQNSSKTQENDDYVMQLDLLDVPMKRWREFEKDDNFAEK